mmetsp:Transcript_37585/g.57585  ORF Transcript_37585/g.57585 Transcript_37585/m.57585 type:complete len:83 (+) Transcript_37585:3696-3944(+)
MPGAGPLPFRKNISLVSPISEQVSPSKGIYNGRGSIEDSGKMPALLQTPGNYANNGGLNPLLGASNPLSGRNNSMTDASGYE